MKTEQARGRLIVLDGLDGSGKQTQTALLLERLRREGKPSRSVSFPDYEQPSSALVKQYLAGDFGQADEVNAYAASSFYAVDRYASYTRFWRKEYLTGYTILADRYVTSNLIHQMSKLPSAEWDGFIRWAEDYEYEKLGLPRPDAVLYLDMPLEVTQQLLCERYGGDETKKDIHESNAAYQARCRACALEAARRLRWTVIPCAKEGKLLPAEQIAERVYAALP